MLLDRRFEPGRDATERHAADSRHAHAAHVRRSSDGGRRRGIGSRARDFITDGPVGAAGGTGSRGWTDYRSDSWRHDYGGMTPCPPPSPSIKSALTPSTPNLDAVRSASFIVRITLIAPMSRSHSRSSK